MGILEHMVSAGHSCAQAEQRFSFGQRINENSMLRDGGGCLEMLVEWGIGYLGNMVSASWALLRARRAEFLFWELYFGGGGGCLEKVVECRLLCLLGTPARKQTCDSSNNASNIASVEAHLAREEKG